MHENILKVLDHVLRYVNAIINKFHEFFFLQSAVVYDKFDSLSLALPPRGAAFKLQHLLEEFVSPELVEGFACDFCNKGRSSDCSPLLSQANKAIKIGKVTRFIYYNLFNINVIILISKSVSSAYNLSAHCIVSIIQKVHVQFY